MSMEQDVGLLQGEMKAVQNELESLTEWVKEISVKQDKTNTMIAEAFASGRGTWRTLAFLGSISVTLGGLAGWALHYFKGIP